MNFYPFNYPNGKRAKWVMKKGTNKMVVETDLGHLCGYVVFPKKQMPRKWWENYDADGLQYLNIHGGITYCKVEEDSVVFGLDCAHAGDEHSLYKSPSYVMQLVDDMEQQLLAYTKVVKKWRQSSRKKQIEILENIRNQAQVNNSYGFGMMIDMLSGGRVFKDVV